MNSPKVLWNLFHPDFDRSRGNRIIFEAVRDIDNVLARDMCRLYGDHEIDIEKEQGLLTSHDLIVFQHPFYWYSCPPLMKEWLDRVLTAGFAYPPKVGKALHKKQMMMVITTGGPEWSYRSGGYNNYTMSELLRPFQQTANLSGMKWMPPFVVHGVLPEDYQEIKIATDDDIREKAAVLKNFILDYDPDETHSIEPLIPPHAVDG